ncbi:MAG: hypothetical protein KME67_19365 [Candidatus Thiodiazotropha sp. (ex Codakia orbicularis)]|nr:hypothetical protein [Candidatus Thiodiazotropha sp. (ex Codakia orbicularis)]
MTALGFGVVVTFLLGVWNLVYNYRNSKRNSFINTVTNERVLWIGTLRANVSKFCGLTHNWAKSQPHETDREQGMLMQIDELRYLIRLQLNPSPEASLDRAIEKKIKNVVDLCVSTPNQDKVTQALDSLTETTQKLLKEEWDKVREESKRGDLRDNEHCLDPLFEAMNSWCLEKTKRWAKNNSATGT